MNEALRTARSCRHYAMCKIDFLGTGVCAAGLERHYASFYPQGRMDLYAALSSGEVPVTPGCVEIAESCDLCGRCDTQCYFVTQMHPTVVMQALKDRVDDYLRQGGQLVAVEADDTLAALRDIVGEPWASNDPAIMAAYAHDLCPIAAPRMPDFVVLPNTKDEIAAVVKLLRARGIPFTARGNGSNTMGFVVAPGAIIDLVRMKTVAFDEKNWLAKVGPGVAAFELQREASKRGLRVHVAEPAALVCANQMCSGIFSTFSASYGTMADNCVDAEFVSPDGAFFTLNALSSPNLFSFQNKDVESPGICTSVSVKLHPVFPDEGGILVPFDSQAEATAFVADCARRRIGLALAVLGSEYVATFLAPTQEQAKKARSSFTERLGIRYLVLVIGDRHALGAVRAMGHPVIEQRLFRALALGLPGLQDAPWLDLLREFSDAEPFSYLRLPRFFDLAQAALAPSAQKLAAAVDEDLRPAFEELYARSEMTDLVWLNTFRIVSSRMGREKHFVALIVYAPIDRALLSELQEGFQRIADAQGLKNAFGFLTPIDDGKRCILEYDYFFQPDDPTEVGGMQQALQESAGFIGEISARTGTVRWMRFVHNQGFSRPENLLYAQP
jgi:hypothetical protein